VTRPLTSKLLAGAAHGFSDKSGLEADDVLQGGRLVMANQVHSNLALEVRRPWPQDQRPDGDALVTGRAGVVLGIVTADCTPILLYDERAHVIGAAHAGWRGALGGVIANTVTAMEALGAHAGGIKAAIGPCIAQGSYEVDAAMRDQFAPAHHGYFEAGRSGHWQFDLPGFVRQMLRASGVTQIDDLARDTYAEKQRFHSYRRATHRGEETGGRQLSMIGLRESE
jgi:YfiH family protein